MSLTSVDCEGHVSETLSMTGDVTSSPTPTPHDDDHEDDHEDREGEEHDDSTGTGSLGPSPTASVGCEAHGNHW
jgi:hypothetical protein